MAEFPEDLRSIKQRLHKISEKGRRQIYQTRQVVRRAEEGEQFIDWLESELWPKAGHDLSTALPSSAFSNKHLDIAERQLAEAGEAAERAAISVNIVVASSSTATGSVVSELFHASPAAADEIRKSWPRFDRTAIQERIDRELSELPDGRRLVERRRGAWAAFEAGGADSPSQACHSMRELLTALLDRYADNSSVKQAAWWEPATDTAHGVSKRQKIRYFISGDYPADPADLEQLEKQVDQAHKAHDAAIAIAHYKTADRQSARVAFEALEDAIGTLLDVRRENLAR